MATTTVKTRCTICGKEKASIKCEGCSQTFCNNHFADHRQELSKQLDEIEVSRDLFRQTLTEQTNEPRKHPLIEQIDTWERESIEKIRRTSEEARQLLLKHTTNHVTEIEFKLAKLTEQLRENRQENDFVEPDLDHWKNELTKLAKQLGEPSNVSIRQGVTPLVTNIFVDISPLLSIPNIGANAKWIQNATTVAGGHGPGNRLNQFCYQYGLYVDDDQTIYVTDYSNQRVMEWNSSAASGQVVAGGNGPGNNANQLNNPLAVIVDKQSDSLIISDYVNKRVVRWPRRNGITGETIISDIGCWGLAMDNCGYLYVSDHSKHEVKRWKIGEMNGTVVAGGNQAGSRLDQLYGPTYIFVDQDHSVYVSDNGNHRVMRWMDGAKEGIVVAGGNGPGNASTQLSYPHGIVVDHLGTVYVTDFSNYRVMRWPKGARQGSVVVGGNGAGAQPNQFNSCWDLSFDRQNNLFVSDHGNSRVQKFNIDTNSTQYALRFILSKLYLLSLYFSIFG